MDANAIDINTAKGVRGLALDASPPKRGKSGTNCARKVKLFLLNRFGNVSFCQEKDKNHFSIVYKRRRKNISHDYEILVHVMTQQCEAAPVQFDTNKQKPIHFNI